MTREEVQDFIKVCKEKYPNPKQGNIRGVDVINDYCVGGATCRYANELKRFEYLYFHSFPTLEIVANMLMALNPKLKGNEVHVNIFAAEIIVQNDEGMFQNAWDALAAALMYEGDNEQSTIPGTPSAD